MKSEHLPEVTQVQYAAQKTPMKLLTISTLLSLHKLLTLLILAS
jgi:hypothetical protein